MKGDAWRRDGRRVCVEGVVIKKQMNGLGSIGERHRSKDRPGLPSRHRRSSVKLKAETSEPEKAVSSTPHGVRSRKSIGEGEVANHLLSFLSIFILIFVHFYMYFSL